MNDTVIFLVLAGIALIFKWLTSQGSGDTEKPKPPSPNEPIRRAPPESEEERVRRFLEALGVPPGSQTPPPARPRTITPRPVSTPAARPAPPKVRRSWVQPLPPLVTTPEDVSLPPLTSAPPAIPEPAFVVEAQPAPAALAPPPLSAELSMPSLAAPPARKSQPVRPLRLTSLRPALRSREKIRQAIILREVLGPPRGLEVFGQFPGH